jgi:hypothetical protein
VLPAPRIIVTKSGLLKSPGDIEYGLILENTSQTRDARNLIVTVQAVDARGRAVATNRTPLTGIPAGGRFVITDSFLSHILLRVRRLRTTIRVGHGSSPSLRLPRTTNVRFQGDLGLFEVRGQVSNPYKKPLTEDAPIFAILLDKRGRIVAVNSPDATGAKVEPGATATFDLPFVSGPTSARPVSALVSIDPCFDPNQCLTVIG